MSSSSGPLGMARHGSYLSCFAVASAVLVCAVFAGVATAARPIMAQKDCQMPDNPRKIESRSLLAALQRGEKRLYSGYVVKGDIRLDKIKTLEVPLVINNSVIKGSILAPFTGFTEAVDLFCTRIQGNVNVFGAVFEKDSRWISTRISGEIRATAARFGGGFNLSGAKVQGFVFFRNAVFSEPATLESARFVRDVDFQRASFEEDAFFTRTVFGQQALFTKIRASSDIGFAGATFNADSFFSGAKIAGRLNFDGAGFFHKPIDCCVVADFDDATAKSLSFRPRLFAGWLHMHDLTLEQLEMELVWVDRIDVTRSDVDRSDDRARALEDIEDTARDDGRIAEANDAAFKRAVLDHMDDARVWKALWWAGGEQVAGYLVRPWRPLRAMLLLLGLGAVARLSARLSDKWREVRRRPRWPPGPRPRSLLERALTALVGALISFVNPWRWPADWRALRSMGNLRWWVGQVMLSFLRALAVAVVPKPPKFDIAAFETERWSRLVGASGLGIEWAVQKFLNAVFLIALGNAVPGVKEIIDAALRR